MRPNADLDRRTFLTATIAACASCAAAAGCTRTAGSEASAGESAELATAKGDDIPAIADGPVDVGTAADYPSDGVIHDAYARSHGFFLVRDNGALYALASACTHKLALLKVKGQAIVCPKHGARFDSKGNVKKAPARRPLARYGITRDGDGRILVDTSRVFEDDARDDEGSRVTIE